MTRRILIGAAIFAALLAVECGGSGPTSTSGGPGPDEVWMQNLSFVPATRTVGVLTTITWTNKDSMDHTVTSGTPGNPEGKFASAVLAPNQTFMHTFNDAGVYPFYCSIHTFMTGTIKVE